MTSNKKNNQIPIFNKNTNEQRMSQPVPVYQQKNNNQQPAVASSQNKADTSQNNSANLQGNSINQSVVSPDVTVTTTSVSASTFSSTSTLNQTPEQKPQQLASTTKDPVATNQAEKSQSKNEKTEKTRSKKDIQNLEQLIAYHYDRKANKVEHDEKIFNRIAAQSARLDNDALTCLKVLSDADLLLLVPSQLLLLCKDLNRWPVIKQSIEDFVKQVMLSAPIFLDENIKNAILQGAEPYAFEQVLKKCNNYQVATDDKTKLKESELKILRQNAIVLLITWFYYKYSLNLEQIMGFLNEVAWLPTTTHLSNDIERFCAVTETSNLAGLGLVYKKLKEKANDSLSLQVQAQKEAEKLRNLLAELESQYESLRVQHQKTEDELTTFKSNTSSEIAELKNQHFEERTLGQHQYEQMIGRFNRLLDENIELLAVGLSALQNKTPKIEVMIERAEQVIDGLRAEKNKL